ncbi:MAG: hypothetical protein J0L67_04765 [Cytophagales bacterium]|jgi:hypothetical protein|nr:hypothetical protein [Cytophagales bacterium]
MSGTNNMNEDLNKPQTNNHLANIILLANALFLVGMILYQGPYVGRFGYSYTVGTVVSVCSNWQAGEGYNFKYIVNRDTLYSCLSTKRPIDFNDWVLLKFPNSDPGRASFTGYKLKERIIIPNGGWNEFPIDYCEEIDR